MPSSTRRRAWGGTPSVDEHQARQLKDGREFSILKVYYEPAELDEALRRAGFARGGGGDNLALLPARERHCVKDRPGQGDDYPGITSLVVSRANEIVHEQYLDGDENTLRDTRSCTKTVLGMLVGIAIQKGLMAGVEVTLRDLLKERPIDAQKAAITVEQLITMSSPLECNDWVDRSPGNEERMYPTGDWAQFALDLPLRTDVGYSYCTAGVVLLGAVASLRCSASGCLIRAEGSLSGSRDRPLRVARDTSGGEDFAAGGLRLTSRGLLGLGNLYLCGGREVVSQAWIDVSTRAHARIDARTEYGYLWWLRSFTAADSYYMTGMGGNRVHVFPDLELVAMITTRNFRLAGAHDLSDRLLINEVLGKVPGPEAALIWATAINSSTITRRAPASTTTGTCAAAGIRTARPTMPSGTRSSMQRVGG